MARDWPAHDMAPLIALIDDPRHRARGRHLPAVRGAGRAILDLRLQRLTALGRDEIGDELNKLAAEIADYLDILRSRARCRSSSTSSTRSRTSSRRRAAPIIEIRMATTSRTRT
jgi:DNA gyrase subunit A